MAALLGTGLGAVLFLPFEQGLPHLAVAVLLVTAAAALQGLKLLKRRWAVPLYATALFLAVELVYVFQSLDPAGRLPPCLTAAVLTGVSAYAYGPLLSPGQETLPPDALRFLAVTVLTALTEVALAGISLGRAMTACLVLVTAWQGGLTQGMATGLWAGLLTDLWAGNGELLFTAAYGVAGLAVGALAGRSRFAAAAAYLCATLALLLPVTDALGVSLLGEALLAAPLFLLIPGKALGGKRLQKPEPSHPSPALETLKTRLSKTAAAFRDLYDTLGRTAQSSEENPAVIFDRAAEKVCRDCALCQLCWKKEYVSTFNALNDATPFLLERGRTLPKDYPPHFRDRCIHLTEFLGAIDGETSAFLLRRQYRKQLEEARSSTRRQYAQLGELLNATAAELGDATPAFAAGPGLAYRIGAALRPKEGESVCGDSVSAFETGGGRLCLLLSDGSGSGEPARRESALTSRLLRQFLEAGVQPEAAMKTLNAALALRSEETGSFATIDLLTVSLQRGEGALYKYGAAPTYLKKSGSVRRITGNALPAGLRTSPAAPDVTKLQLEPGSFTVMVSDGVADALGDEWLQDLLAGWEGTDPQQLAGLVMQEAAKRGHLADDCAVQTLYLDPAAPERRQV
jgi:stage II sporulation protein E